LGKNRMVSQQENRGKRKQSFTHQSYSFTFNTPTGIHKTDNGPRLFY